MHFLSTLSIAIAVASTASANQNKCRAACNADNCARLITGTQKGLPSTRLADCSAALIATVTPSPVTTTITATAVAYDTVVSTVTTNPVDGGTITVTVTANQVVRPSAQPITFKPRDNAQTVSVTSAPAPTVPSYATASCPAFSRYTSACSCAGIKASTVTASGETITQTQTITAAATTVITTAASTTIQATTTVNVGGSKSGYACGSTVQGNGIYSFRRYRVQCGQRVTGGTVNFNTNSPQESDCLRQCNSIKYCVYAQYTFSSGQCDLYFQSPTAVVDDANVDALILI